MILNRILLIVSVILCISLFITNLFLVKVILTLIIFISLILTFALKKEKDPSLISFKDDDFSIKLLGNKEASEKIEVLQNERNIAQSELESYKSTHTEAYKTYRLFGRSIDVSKQLSDLVIKKTENSVNTLTQSFFSISESNKKVDEKIQHLLNTAILGDKSLGKDIDVLSSDVDNLADVTKHFTKIIDGYSDDIKNLQTTVNGIEEYTTNITDLADRTNVLAINASIEAARVGQAGKGFAVIAGEIQKLAKWSKDIAEDITHTLNDTISAINNSFQDQIKKISGSIKNLEESQNSLQNISSNLKPQVEVITNSIQESNRLSEIVTQRINEVVVSLQFHDIIKQMVNHIIQIITEIYDNSLMPFVYDCQSKLVKNSDSNSHLDFLGN